MRVAQVCFVVAGISALSAAGVAVAQVQYPDQLCFGTPVPQCQSQCGCPIPNATWDFCSGAFPPGGGSTVTYYYCTPSSGFTCTAPNKSCGGVVVNCSTNIDPQTGNGTPCGCCGQVPPPNPACTFCWNCPTGFTCPRTVSRRVALREV